MDKIILKYDIYVIPWCTHGYFQISLEQRKQILNLLLRSLSTNTSLPIRPSTYLEYRLPLSLYIYIYICVCVCVCLDIHMYLIREYGVYVRYFTIRSKLVDGALAGRHNKTQCRFSEIVRYAVHVPRY